MSIEMTKDEFGEVVAKITADATPSMNEKMIDAKPRTFDEITEVVQGRIYEVEEITVLQGALLYADKEIKRLEKNADQRLKQKNQKLTSEIKDAAGDLKMMEAKIQEVEKALQKSAFIIQKVMEKRRTPTVIK